MKSTHADPTANAAIAKVTREEKNKKVPTESQKEPIQTDIVPRYSEWAFLSEGSPLNWA